MPGPRKRVSRLDALQLGFSGTVGLSIATILAVTSVQCAQLESDVERQLKDLATELDQELVAEITSSAQTLDALEAWLGSCPSGTRRARNPADYPVKYPRAYPLGSVVEPNCTATSAPQLAGVDSEYRNYDVAALIDKHGRQVRKAWPKRGEAAVGRRQRPPVLQRGIHLLAGPADAECPGRRDNSVHGPAVRASVAGVVHHRSAERGAGQAVAPGRFAARRGDHAADAVGHQSGDPARIRVRHHRQGRPGGVPFRCPAKHLRGPVPRNRPQPPAAIAGGDRRRRLGPHRVLGPPVPRAREARAGLRLVGRHAVRPADAARADARVDDGQPPVPRRVHRAVGRRRRPRRHHRRRVALAGSVSQAALLAS